MNSELGNSSSEPRNGSADRIWLMPYSAPIQVGAPEDLVLNGAFEAAFRSEGVAFDQATGSFRIHTDYTGEIALSGDDEISLLWTRRALEREGFAVNASTTNDSNVSLRVLNTNDGVLWRLRRDQSSHDYASLYDLIDALRQ